jgi:hypothetical protein
MRKGPNRRQGQRYKLAAADAEKAEKNKRLDQNVSVPSARGVERQR